MLDKSAFVGKRILATSKFIQQRVQHWL